MVLVGLGSNQGESTEIVIAAMHALARLAQPGSVRSSSLWRTSPVNCPPESGDFINAAVVFDALPDLTPEMLLSRLKTLEREFGRAERYHRNAPRELDLDLLLFGSERRQSEHFTLPHPRATDRLFVLKPASQLIPHTVWPGLGQSIQQLLESLETDEVVYALSEQPPYFGGQS